MNLRSLTGWRIVSRMENARGIAIIKIPFADGWFLGIILLEPDFKEFFAGWFKRCPPTNS